MCGMENKEKHCRFKRCKRLASKIFLAVGCFLFLFVVAFCADYAIGYMRIPYVAEIHIGSGNTMVMSYEEYIVSSDCIVKKIDKDFFWSEPDRVVSWKISRDDWDRMVAALRILQFTELSHKKKKEPLMQLIVSDPSDFYIEIDVGKKPNLVGVYHTGRSYTEGRFRFAYLYELIMGIIKDSRLNY